MWNARKMDGWSMLTTKTKAFSWWYLNVNMTFPFIRSDDYEDIAQAHNLFLLKPFLEHRYIVPMDGDFLLRMQAACEGMEKELAEQSDWYWSCRSRSYFMEVIIALERMDELYKKETQKEDSVSSMNYAKIRIAMDYMESHYSESITLKEVTKHCGFKTVQHFSRVFKKKVGETPLTFRREAVEKRKREIQS